MDIATHIDIIKKSTITLRNMMPSFQSLKFHADIWMRIFIYIGLDQDVIYIHECILYMYVYKKTTKSFSSLCLCSPNQIYLQWNDTHTHTDYQTLSFSLRLWSFPVLWLRSFWWFCWDVAQQRGRRRNSGRRSLQSSKQRSCIPP